MEIFKFSECQSIKQDENGNFSIFLQHGAGVLKISGPEVLAMASAACATIAEQAQIPLDFIQKFSDTIKHEPEEEKD